MRLKEELEGALNISAKIRWGRPGQMDVVVDGKIVFSKKVSNRLPDPGEVLGLVKAFQAAGSTRSA